jgi:PAS domain S-box-containing protein
MISGFDTTKSQLYHATRVHLPLVRVSRIVSFACAAAVVLAAMIVLAGWAIAPALTALGAGGVPMNPLTAVCLLLLGVGLLFVLPTPHGRAEAVAGTTLAAIALALAAAKLLMLRRTDGPDTWLFHDALNAAAPVSRMAPSTAFLVAATAIAILLLDVEIRGRRPAQFVILVSLPLTFVVQIGYLFRIAELEGWGAYIPMARATAIALGMLQLAIVAGRVEHGLTRIFVAQGPGGVTARRLFPAVIIAPVAIGYLRLIGQRRGVFGPEFGVVLFTIAMVVLFSILVWSTAQKVHAVDAVRAETDLRLQTLIRHVPLGIVVLDLDGRVQLCNEAFVELFHYPAHELMGRRLDELIAPAEDGGETASLTRRGFAGESVRRTTVRRRRDGTLIDVEVYVVPLAMDGQAIGTYGVYRDLQSGARRP